jgi:flagellar biosynthetic protein FlhB
VADDRGERTEQPTGKRLGEARERGQIARTQEAGAAVTVLAIAGFLTWAAPTWLASFQALLGDSMTEMRATPWTLEHAEQFGWKLLGYYVALAAPPMLTIAAAAIVVNVAQVGFVVSGKALQPNWSKLSPLTGLKTLFGRAALVELAKAPIKLLILGGLTWITIKPALVVLFWGTGQSATSTFATVGELVVTLLWRIGLAQAALAALDYGYQRWSHRRNLRMTRQDVKEETRQSEGDPMIRGRFRALHRQYAMRRMMQDVARADVVVTNPTHLAVALKYEPGSMSAPRVVAKGARLIAGRIRELARAAGVPIVEHKPLAQALYKAVPVGGEIPADLYRAVAEILAYVWSLGRRREAGGA